MKTALRPENFDERSAVVLKKNVQFLNLYYVFTTSRPGSHCA